jgi:hypothetical protein
MRRYMNVRSPSGGRALRGNANRIGPSMIEHSHAGREPQALRRML